MSPNHRLKLFINAKYTRVKDFAEDLGIYPGDVSKYTNEGGSQFVTLDKINRLRELGLNTDWYRTGEGEMLLVEKPQINNKNKGVPYYPIDVTASLVRSFNDVQEHPDFYVDFKPFNDCTAYFPVYGDSMYPQYCSGDIVAVIEIKKYNIIEWGHAYLIITNEESNNLRTIKTIHQHDTDKNKIILRASNPRFKGDIEIEVHTIVGLYKIKGKIHIESV